jgi:hypothetical protein
MEASRVFKPDEGASRLNRHLELVEPPEVAEAREMVDVVRDLVENGEAAILENGSVRFFEGYKSIDLTPAQLARVPALALEGTYAVSRQPTLPDAQKGILNFFSSCLAAA